MFLEIFSDTEFNYHVEIFCPKCGSDNVVIEVVNGFFYFSSCNNCSYHVARRVNKTNGANHT